jgi:hypothetical protein
MSCNVAIVATQHRNVTSCGATTLRATVLTSLQRSVPPLQAATLTSLQRSIITLWTAARRRNVANGSIASQRCKLQHFHRCSIAQQRRNIAGYGAANCSIACYSAVNYYKLQHYVRHRYNTASCNACIHNRYNVVLYMRISTSSCALYISMCVCISFWSISFYLWLVLVFLFNGVSYGFTPLRHCMSQHYTSR